MCEQTLIKAKKPLYIKDHICNILTNKPAAAWVWLLLVLHMQPVGHCCLVDFKSFDFKLGPDKDFDDSLCLVACFSYDFFIPTPFSCMLSF